jgi:hypothetical protein
VCIIVFAVAFAAAPLPFVLLLDQPGVPPWAVTLATIPAWLWLSMPLHNVVGWVGKLLGRDLDERALPYLSSSRQRIERVTISDLMLRDKGIGWPTIIRIYALSLWMVPLSIWWLLA